MPAVKEIFTGTARDLSSEGAGVVEHESGQIFFVAGVWPGEEGEFQVTGFRKRFGFARPVKITKPSAARVDPVCPHHGFGGNDCGGCPWQFIAYPAQLDEKQRRVARAMDKLGIGEHLKNIIPSPKQFGYRNRAQLKSDGERIGYVAPNSRRLAAITDCAILSDHNRETLHGLLASLPNPQFKPGRKASWTTLDIDEDLTADQVSVNSRRVFRQANSDQNIALRHWLRDNVQPLNKGAGLVELFAGSGNFTEVLSEAGFERILAVEGVSEAVEILEEKQLAGVSVTIADLFTEEGAARVGRELPDGEILVLDPPRDGFRPIGTLLDTCERLSRIFYISCDLATFSRDLQVCLDSGFGVTEVQPFDLFPHTPHIEVMASLTKS